MGCSKNSSKMEVFSNTVQPQETRETVRASLIAQLVKNLPAMQETQLRSLGQEDPLEKKIATHSSILTWRIPWTEEPGGLKSMGSQRVRHDFLPFSSRPYSFKLYVEASISSGKPSWDLGRDPFLRLHGGGGLVAKSCLTLAIP